MGTQGRYFYRPDYGEYGLAAYTDFDEGLVAADEEIYNSYLHRTDTSRDDHTQYLHLDKAGQTLQKDLAVASGIKIDGRDISQDGARLDTVMWTLKFLSAPVRKIEWTTLNNWTDVNISTDTGNDTAKAALLAVTLLFIPQTAGLSSALAAYFRKNGWTGESILPKITAAGTYFGAIGRKPGRTAGMIIVECDANEIFEVKLVSELPGDVSDIIFQVDLIGYFV